MNQSESKYFNTAVRMNEALLSLLEVKSFEYITVKEICNKAGVNRSTFYLHYETIGNLLAETVEVVMKRLTDKFKSLETITPEQIAATPTDKLILVTPGYLNPYLEFVKENRRIFNVAVTQPTVIQVNSIFDQYYADFFYPIMKRFGFAEEEAKYMVTFYLQGMFAVICRWIKGNCAEDIHTMTDLLMRCVFAGKLPL